MATNVSHFWPRLHRALSLMASVRKQKIKQRNKQKLKFKFSKENDRVRKNLKKKTNSKQPSIMSITV